jgi:hypothetical protein
MRTKVPEKILKIIEEIEVTGHANLMRLAVLKKWFEYPRRLQAFGLWVATKASARKGKTIGVGGELFAEARFLLATRRIADPGPDPIATKDLRDRLKAFQNEYQRQAWGPVQIIKNWNLMLVEEGLSLYLGYGNTPSDGYRLASNYCQHFNPRYGNSLDESSHVKLAEMVRFMFTLEGIEDDLEVDMQ